MIVIVIYIAQVCPYSLTIIKQILIVELFPRDLDLNPIHPL